MTVKSFLFTLFMFGLLHSVKAQTTVDSSIALIKRVLPAHAHRFRVETLKSTKSTDRFELESRNGQIILRGNNGVSIASALYHYITEYAGGQLTWNGSNLKMPSNLPMLKHKVIKETPYNFRYYLNYCTFNYTMSWWDWPRWEKEIDWMALHGINMPLAITGQEYTWYLVYKELGFSDQELKNFFTGPAYLAWFWMGNMDAWGGPLPLRWMKSHMELQQKILTRQRALGMKPILSAFTGHVPPAFSKKFPNAKLKTTNWNNGFADNYILDSEDPLFNRIGKMFLKKQTELLGTDHYYSADTFNENEPPTNEPEYLGKLSARVYDAMHQADSNAVWVMQGWLFYADRKFWGKAQTEALLKSVPDDKMIILDLAAEVEPIWKRTEAFYGKPWIWSMVNNFGGNTNIFGRMEEAATGPSKALQSTQSGRLTGIGLTMEGIEQNPVIYELFTANTWTRDSINLNEWLPKYVRNRYGTVNKQGLKAWSVLRGTVYTVPKDKYIRDGAESILQARPTLDSTTQWTKTKLNYNPKDLLPAWHALVAAADELKKSEGFRFDLIDVSRQVLANYALVVHQKWVTAYRAKDAQKFKLYSDEFISLIEDMDGMLASHPDFLLGKWVAQARRWGSTDEERNLYEQNAKNLITLWGDKDAILHEYACRQWSGLLNDYYKPRWTQFFSALSLDLQGKKSLDNKAFTRQIKVWEWEWVNARKDYPVAVQGNTIDQAKKIYTKYSKVIDGSYQ
ncbi:alpha-N-acetylglucosaminidase [Pedobacter petrophilus]|uniref:Alpha-N-acetylglucosaminidase n=3 Tax=Pedobacter TaxID=84567 RepID=A0A7K0G3C2_9SPHI|nr:alpha-N-acetylglucosaminidase [Pedobacter petrophilus]